MIKNISLLTRKPGMTHAQFVKHWTEVHGPLAIGIPGLRRYVQSHITGERSFADLETSDIEVDGIAELWWDDAESMARGFASPQAKALHADNANFIGRIKAFTIEEKTVIG